MKATTYAQTLHELGVIREEGMEEVILGHRELSRFGRLQTEEFLKLCQRARELNLRVILEWDILMTEDNFQGPAKLVQSLASNVDALRVQDPGALEWALRHTEKPLQFIAENGNHNLLGLQAWVDHCGQRLERLVLSIELPNKTLENFLSHLTVPCELLVLGRILLFYSPRSLLSPLTGEPREEEFLSAMGESEESPHKGFPIEENRHGTFMFHIKDFSLLELLQDLRAMGLAFGRIDLRWEKTAGLRQVLDLWRNFSAEAFAEFKQSYGPELTRGFHLVNKTDVLFPKLKNHRLQKREGNYLGEVLEAQKSSHLAILVKHPRGLRKGDRVLFVHPEGNEYELQIFKLRNSALEEVDEIKPQGLAIVQFVVGVWSKSHAFLLSAD